MKNHQAHLYAQHIDYQDTDAGGVVYHASYINFAERARSQLFRALCEDASHKYLWVVTDLHAKFVYPARLNDYINVRTSIIEVHNCSIVLLQEVLVKDRLCVTMKIKLACLDHNFKVTKISSDIKEILVNDCMEFGTNA